MYVGGSATVTLTNTTLSDDAAKGGTGGGGAGGDNGGSGQGGGVYVGGTATVTLTDATLSKDTAQGGDGGSADLQGGTGGSGEGGGVYAGESATLTLTNITLSGDAARGGNGGFGFTFGSIGGDGRGGGVCVGGSATVTLTNATLSGGTAQGGAGSEGVLGQGGGGNGQAGGLFNGGTTTLRNCIVANSTSGVDVFNSGTLNGSTNLIESGSGLGGMTGTVTADPNLSSQLADYGGPTQTHALLPGSPAIDAGASGAGLPPTDQRGMFRVGGVDLGAFESQGFTLTPVAGSSPQAAAPSTPFANPLALTVTANNPAEPVDGGRVTFAAPMSGASAALSATTATIAGGQVAVSATANATLGSYLATAATVGATSVSFALTNSTRPTDISLNNTAVDENQPPGTTVGTFSTTDPDAGDSFTYALVSGVGDSDNAAFTIVGNQLQTAVTFDFEGQKFYSIRVQSKDAGGLFTEAVFTISVTNVNEAPTFVALGAPGGVTVNEGGLAFNTVTFSDPDMNLASVTASPGSLTPSPFLPGFWLWSYTPPDGPNGPTTVRLTATDSGGLTATATFPLTVTDVAPTIAISGAASGNEGAPYTLTLGAVTDPGSDTVTAYVVNWGDNSSDTYDTAVGAKTHIYSGGGTRVITVDLVDEDGPHADRANPLSVGVNATPTAVALSHDGVAENQPVGTLVGTFSTTDPDAGDTFTYALVGGDATAFTIDGNQLKAAAGFNFEAKSSYSIRVRSTDAGGLWTEKEFTVSVTDLDEAVLLGVRVQNGQRQRSRLTGLQVVFSGPVNLQLGAFQLRRGSKAVQLQEQLEMVNGQAVVTLTFRTGNLDRRALADGRYVLSIDGDRIRDAFGQPLAGLTEARFFRLYGDTNGNGLIDAVDRRRLRRLLKGDLAARRFRLLFVPATGGDLRRLDAVTR